MLLFAGCAAALEPLTIVTIEEQLDLPPAVVVLPVPEPIKQTLPTSWVAYPTDTFGLLFGLSEVQHQALILWLTDASRYIDEVNGQLDYYRAGLREEDNE